MAVQEGVIISKALRAKKAVMLVNYEQLTAGVSIQKAAYLSVYLERAASIQIRASTVGDPKAVPGELAYSRVRRWISYPPKYLAFDCPNMVCAAICTKVP